MHLSFRQALYYIRLSKTQEFLFLHAKKTKGTLKGEITTNKCDNFLTTKLATELTIQVTEKLQGY